MPVKRVINLRWAESIKEYEIRVNPEVRRYPFAKHSMEMMPIDQIGCNRSAKGGSRRSHKRSATQLGGSNKRAASSTTFSPTSPAELSALIERDSRELRESAQRRLETVLDSGHDHMGHIDADFFQQPIEDLSVILARNVGRRLDLEEAVYNWVIRTVRRPMGSR